MVLVMVSYCPEIIVKPDDIILDAMLPVEDVLEMVVEWSLAVNVMNAFNIDKMGHVIPLLCYLI